MALLKWYTQPESDLKSDMHFASYYLYDPVSHLYVRIRLDLNRPTKDDDDGNPAIACRKNRIVKVSKDDRKTYSEVKNNNDPKAGGLILDHNRDNNMGQGSVPRPIRDSDTPLWIWTLRIWLWIRLRKY